MFVFPNVLDDYRMTTHVLTTTLAEEQTFSKSIFLNLREVLCRTENMRENGYFQSASRHILPT